MAANGMDSAPSDFRHFTFLHCLTWTHMHRLRCRPGAPSKPLRRERSNTLAVGWWNASGTWPSERGRRLERTVRRSRVRSRLWRRTMPGWLLRGTLPSNSAIWPFARQCARSSTAVVHTLPRRSRRTFWLTQRFATFTGGNPTRVPAGGTACPRAL